MERIEGRALTVGVYEEKRLGRLGCGVAGRRPGVWPGWGEKWEGMPCYGVDEQSAVLPSALHFCYVEVKEVRLWGE